MKSTFKRILALVMVFCTVAAWMIPGVSVATASTTEDNSTTYNIWSEFTALGLGSTADIIYNKTLQAGYTTIKTAYDAGTIDFMVDSSTLYRNRLGTYSKFGGSYLQLYTGMSYDTARYHTAFRIKAPSTGDFTLSVTYSAGSFMDEEIVRYAGAYIMEAPETSYDSSAYWGTGTLNEAVEAKVAEGMTTVLDFNPYDASIASGTGVKTEATGTVKTSLVEGKDYLVVFYITNKGDNADLNFDNTTGNSRLFLQSFTLNKVVPEAIIEGEFSGTLADALTTAVSGDTIVLNKDVTASEVNLDTGVTLDLNGCILTADAVVGTVKDSSDGNGRVATAQESVITAPDGQIALWDNTTGADGYRIFKVTLANYGNDISEVANADKVLNFATIGADTGLTMYSSSSHNVNLINGITLSEDGETLNTKYDEGYTWGIVTGAQNYLNHARYGNNSLTLSAAGKYNDDYTKVGGVALKFKAPGTGVYDVSMKYIARPGNDVADKLDMWIVPMPEDTNLASEKYALANALNAGYPIYRADGTTAADYLDEDAKILTTAIQDASMTATYEGRVADGKAYQFEAGKEYLLVLAIGETSADTSNTTPTCSAEISNITFTADKSRTFWSTLKFENANAYSLVASGLSGLKFGYEMDWNGAVKNFPFEDSMVAEWGNTQANDLANTYGLYIRVTGFEALNEAGTLKATPYITSGSQTIKVAEPMKYEYTPVAE